MTLNGTEIFAEHIKNESLQDVKNYLNNLLDSGDIDTLVTDLYTYYAVVGFCAKPDTVNIIKDKLKKEGWIYECQD